MKVHSFSQLPIKSFICCLYLQGFSLNFICFFFWLGRSLFGVDETRATKRRLASGLASISRL